MIPPIIKESLIAYVLQGRPTGGFLHAVLSNDLMQAMDKADDINRYRLFDICQYIYEKLPHTSYGNKENVTEWLRLHREEPEQLKEAVEILKDRF